MTDWVALALAGCFEVGFTTFMKLSDGFSRVGYTVGFVVCVLGSFALLSRATTTIPMGTAYAIWTGIGAAGTVVVGSMAFGEPITPLRMLLLLTLFGSVVGLKVVG